MLGYNLIMLIIYVLGSVNLYWMNLIPFLPICKVYHFQSFHYTFRKKNKQDFQWLDHLNYQLFQPKIIIIISSSEDQQYLKKINAVSIENQNDSIHQHCLDNVDIWRLNNIPNSTLPQLACAINISCCLNVHIRRWINVMISVLAQESPVPKIQRWSLTLNQRQYFSSTATFICDQNSTLFKGWRMTLKQR